MSQKIALRLLIVDPDDDLRSVMTTLFELMGCTVEAARNGAEAMAGVKVSMPDVVLTELALEDVDGFKLASQLRSHAGAENVVLLAHTATYRKGMEIEALKAGFASYLLKPARIERVLSVLEPIAATKGRRLLVLNVERAYGDVCANRSYH
jgi:CheY-like chemotaxis protein